MNPIGTLRRLDPFAILAFSIPLTIYLLTLAPSVTFFDSGEFITAVSSLGIAHSPGYPLFINYAKPFTWLPFGSIAFRVNIATALSAAFACYGVYLLTCQLLKDETLPVAEEAAHLLRRAAALAASLSFAFTARLWLQSNHDKPYPLLSFLCAVIFFLMLRWRESYQMGEERPSYVYLGAFLCGLGTGAHQIMVLMIPAYAYLLISKDWRVLCRVKELLIAVAFGILGFSIHLHLVVRALQKPLLNWGDSRNLTQFLWNLLRKGYPTEKPVRDLQLLWTQLQAFNIPHEFTVAGLFLMLVGLIVSLKRNRDAALAYLIGILSFLLIIVGYFNTPADFVFLTEEFFTPLYLLSAVFIGVAFFAFLRFALGKLPETLRLRATAQGALALSLFAFPGMVCALHYRENDQHQNYIAYDYANNTLRSLPQGAVMYSWGDSGAFPLWYLQGVERMRDDLDLPHTPHLVFDWYLDGLPRLFSDSRLRAMEPNQLNAQDALLVSVMEQIPRRPVFIDFSTRYSFPFDDLSLHQRGIIYRLAPPGEPQSPPDPAVWSLYALRGIVGGSGMFFRDLDTGKAIMIYGSARMESGEAFLKMGHMAAGMGELEQAWLIAPEMEPQLTQLRNSYGVR